MSEPLIPIPRQQALIFACFLVWYEFLTYIANDMIMPGMINVVRSFNASEANVATSVTAYILGGASLQLFLGPISDVYGRRPLMLAGAFLFFVFTLFLAGSYSMNSFLIARFFQGMGLCFICVVGYATLQEIFEEMDAIRLVAIMANAAILAPLLGPLLGAIIIHYTTWRMILLMIAVGALLAFWGLWRFMPESLGQIKKDGGSISKSSFCIKSITNNYKKLFTHPTFCFSILSIGIVGIPCIAWIALSPIILITEAKLTVIQYGLWQLPIFGATILGNWILQKLTYRYSMKQMIFIGSVIMGIALALISLLPLIYGKDYQLLLPGIIIYFFSLSIINAPLNRFCLFITSVSKGTASAIISLSVMIIGAIGIEIANVFYRNHNNLDFGLFCDLFGILFFISIYLTFKSEKKMNLKADRHISVK